MTDNKSLVRRQLEESMTADSLTDLVNSAESVMLLIDTSSSMLATLANGQRAIDALRVIVQTITSQGQLPMIAFGGPADCSVRFVNDVPDAAGATPLHMAIPLAKTYGATRLVVISDGAPDLTEQSLIEARNFGGQIDVVFVGNPGDYGSVFLDTLAKETGGVRMEGDLTNTKKLVGMVIGLLEGEVEKPVIQGEGFTSVDEADVVEAEDDEDDDEDEDEDEDDEEDEDDR